MVEVLTNNSTRCSELKGVWHLWAGNKDSGITQELIQGFSDNFRFPYVPKKSCRKKAAVAAWSESESAPDSPPPRKRQRRPLVQPDSAEPAPPPTHTADVAADQSGSGCVVGHRSGGPGPGGPDRAPALPAHQSDSDSDGAAEISRPAAKVRARSKPSKESVPAPAGAAAAATSDTSQRVHGSKNEPHALPINQPQSVAQQQEPPGELPQELGGGPGGSASAVAQLNSFGVVWPSLQPAAQTAPAPRGAVPGATAPPEEDDYDE